MTLMTQTISSREIYYLFMPYFAIKIKDARHSKIIKRKLIEEKLIPHFIFLLAAINAPVETILTHDNQCIQMINLVHFIKNNPNCIPIIKQVLKNVS